MQNDIAIRVNGLSKVYQKKNKNGNQEDFYALKDVNFEVKKGEVVGIIGKNGSGKSTLLKILSGVTKPTTGSVEINGTLASILDVGAGFHPELTGKENIYLRGKLLGMSTKEIDEAFNEIVDFSEIGDFINTSVKNYSSGMFLRLAFSILVFLKCDILLLDEVMAVGDMSFRKKTTKKLNSLTKNKTIIIVSHENKNLEDSNKFLLLNKGKIIERSNNYSLVKRYTEKEIKAQMGIIEYNKNVALTDFQEFNANNEININCIKFYQNKHIDYFRTDLPFYFEMEYQVIDNQNTYDLVLVISDLEGNIIFSTANFISGNYSASYRSVKKIEKCKIDENIFLPEFYWVSFFFIKNATEKLLEGVTNNKTIKHFEVGEKLKPLSKFNLFGFKSKYYRGNKVEDISKLNLKGFLMPSFTWNIKEL